MAGPNDIYEEFTPSGVPREQFVPGVSLAGPGADPNSAARELAAAQDEAARVATPAGAVTVVPNSAADEWNARFLPGGESYSLTPSQWNDLNPVMPVVGRGRGRRGFDVFGNAQANARDLHASTADVIAAMRDAKKNVESAEFAQEFSQIGHSDPHYAMKFADLVAKYPNAGGKLVDALLQDKQTSRENYLKALDNGGASTYGSKDHPTAAYNAYVTEFGKSKDPHAAHAAAERVAKDESVLDAAAKKGLLTEADIPEWNENWRFSSSDNVRPKGWNRDGTLNYTYLKKIAAEREGKGLGLKEQQTQMKEEDSTIRDVGKQLAEMDPTDPNYAVLHDVWQGAVNSRAARLKGQAQAGGTVSNQPAAGPAAGPTNKPKTVTQNGFTYTLQPDGSYK